MRIESKPLMSKELSTGTDCEDEGRVAEHHFKEAASHPEDSDGDVQK